MNFLSDFGVQWVLLAAQAVNFFLLLFLLKKFLYKPVLTMLDTRKEKIAKAMKDAEEIEQRLLKTEEDREKKLTLAAEEAKKILEEATKAGQEVIAQAHQKAAEDIQGLIAKSEQSRALEREKMHQEIKNELSVLVMKGLEMVSRKVLTKKDQEEVINSSLKELK